MFFFLPTVFCTYCVCQCVAMCLGQAPLTRNVKLSADCCTIWSILNCVGLEMQSPEYFWSFRKESKIKVGSTSSTRAAHKNIIKYYCLWLWLLQVRSKPLNVMTLLSFSWPFSTYTLIQKVHFGQKKSSILRISSIKWDFLEKKRTFWVSVRYIEVHLLVVL